MPLTDKTILITGAFGALGSAIARAALAQGARVAAVDYGTSPATPIDGARLFGGVDLADADAAKAVVEKVAKELGAMDALINVAGTFRWETLADGDAATWDLLYRINLRTAVITSQAALPHLLARGSGRIVNIGATAATKAALGMGAYAASKAGVARLTEALAEELKDRGVTVNAILPSIIDTTANRKDMPDADFSRWVKPEQIADVVLFLLSDRADAITGALIPVVGRV